MKHITKQYRYDDNYFYGKIPADAIQARPRENADSPILLKENLLSVMDCRLIANQFLSTGSNDTPGTRGDNVWHNTVRSVYSFALEGEARDIYQAAIESIRDDIVDYFGVSLVNSSGAHGLGYKVGCKYDLHTDNCDVNYDNVGNAASFRLTNPSRNLSTLLFLTDSVDDLNGEYQHIGGNLTFPFLVDENNECLLLEPRCGLFAVFPSDPVYSHQVHEVYAVSTRFRFAIVDWHSCKKVANRT